MKYPKLKVIPTSRQMIDAFGGYNHNLRINENEFFEMKNMTSDYYPVLSPRSVRSTYVDTVNDPGREGDPTNINGIIAKDALCYIDGIWLYINRHRVDGFKVTDGPKTLISMGAYLLIFPDKKYINTENHDDWGFIDNTTTSSGDVNVALSKADGSVIDNAYFGESEPEKAENGQYWVDTSTTPHTLKQYSSTSALMWATVPTTYVRIEAGGIGRGFKKYDGVRISGMTDSSLNGSFVLQDVADNYIVVTGIISEAYKQDEQVTVSRKMPELDYIVECGNRLWGCRYGPDLDSEIVNEIYASKLGDFKNWECYMGISTDSWRSSVGTDGFFTGAITHMGFPVFFKENCLHKVYISPAGAHQVQDTACRGVQKGCEKSLAIVNETLYYKSKSGVMAYDGSLPVSISYALGDKKYRNAIAAAHGNKYYISMIGEYDNNSDLFVYDVAKGMWHKEDNFRMHDFCSNDGELYAISEDRHRIAVLAGVNEVKMPEKEVVDWSVETGEIGLTSPDMKFMSRLTIRMFLPPESSVRIKVQYGFSDEWTAVFETTSTSLRSFSVPIRPKRCDFMRIRVDGSGDAKIYAITKTMRNGSEIS